MTETRSRSIRVADDVWEAIQALPGKTDDALRDVLLTKAAPKVDSHAEVNRWFRETWERLDEILEVVQPPSGAGVWHKAEMVAGVRDPASIPGVSVGVPRATGQFPCRCVHSGCQGAKFQGASKFANRCPECEEKGHTLNSRECQECFNDMGPA